MFIEILNGWSLDQVTTLAQCDEAEVALTGAIANIEGQIANPITQDPEWMRRATFSLKMKRVALQAVNRKRGEIRRETGVRFERQFLNQCRERHPAVYRELVEALHG